MNEKFCLFIAALYISHPKKDKEMHIFDFDWITEIALVSNTTSVLNKMRQIDEKCI